MNNKTPLRSFVGLCATKILGFFIIKVFRIAPLRPRFLYSAANTLVWCALSRASSVESLALSTRLGVSLYSYAQYGIFLC